MSSTALGAFVGAVGCAALSPYLARLTLSVPDRADKRWLRGRRTASTRLAVTAAAAILLGGLAGAAAHWSALLPAFLLLAVTGTPLAIIDFEHHRLPDRLTYPTAAGAAALFALAAAIRHDWPDYLRAVEAAAAVFVVLLALHLLSPAFGRGDVKLGAILGGYLGWHSWVAVYLGIFAGFLIGSLFAIVLLAVRRVTRKTPLAFGPMLLLGALVVLAFDVSPHFASSSN